MRALVVILAAMGLAALPAAGASAASGGWARMGAVQARGGPYLTDSLGRRLELHGVNVVDKCGGGAVDLAAAGTPCVGPALGSGLAYVLSPQAADPARRFTSADAQTLARLGFNVVRLGIIWEGLEPGPPGVGPNDPRYCAPHRGTRFPRLGAADPYDPATVRTYLARTDVIVGLLARAGLRVILDMHSDVWGSAFSDALGTTPWSGEGAPLWATCTGRAAFRAPPGWGTAYSSPAVQTAIHHFFANDVRGDLEAQYARVWQAVARHYRGNPAVIGYEVYNEPNDFRVRDFDAELQCDYGGPAREPRSCAAAGRPAALPEGLIGAIEAADRTHVVLFEPSGATDYGTPETIGITEPLRFPRLALAFHVYGAVPAQLRQTQAERHRTRTDQPGGPAWIMDEFGASDNPPLVRSVSGAADTMNLSWTYWSAMQFDDPTAGDAAEGLLDQATRQPIPAMARALAVPYPWATAGVPGAQSFDRATRAFRYRYRPDRAVRVATDLELPPYTYPTGYTVQVTGARVLSRRNAALLELRALPHAARVSVTVRARPGAPVRRRGTAPAAPGRRR